MCDFLRVMGQVVVSNQSLHVSSFHVLPLVNEKLSVRDWMIKKKAKWLKQLRNSKDIIVICTMRCTALPTFKSIDPFLWISGYCSCAAQTKRRGN